MRKTALSFLTERVLLCHQEVTALSVAKPKHQRQEVGGKRGGSEEWAEEKVKPYLEGTGKPNSDKAGMCTRNATCS